MALPKIFETLIVLYKIGSLQNVMIGPSKNFYRGKITLNLV